MSKITDATTMTAEASKTEATRSKPEPAYRKPTQTRDGRLRQQMVASYTAALGGRVNPIVMQDVERVADLMMLAKAARADLLAGKATINDVVKLEGTLGRALKRLNLPASGSATPMDLHDIVAKRTAERANPVEEAD
jgi:hypothetical protein